MASPLKSGKQTVDLAAKSVRVSKIRRDPPPAVNKLSIEDRDERDRRLAFIGVILFAIAIVLIILGIASYNGWSPSQVTYRMRIA
jgi:hypothetical protein